MPPIRLHWIKVEIPEAKRDMDTRKLVVSKSSFNAPAMIRGGVMMATKIASKCCMAAKWPLVQGAVVQSVNQSGIGLGGLRFLHGIILF